MLLLHYSCFVSSVVPKPNSLVDKCSWNEGDEANAVIAMLNMPVMVYMSTSTSHGMRTTTQPINLLLASSCAPSIVLVMVPPHVPD